MAECHPVGFQWVMEAKARGAKLIHVDPRFTRTSALADMHVPLRAGSDIVFIGGIINYVLGREKYFRDYVVNYTNAAVLLTEDFQDTEDLDGVFSGLDREHRTYDFEAWRYQGGEVAFRALYPGDGRAGLRRTAGRVHQGLRARDREFGPRAHHGVRLQRRLDPAHRWRAVHPHRRHPPVAARQHRQARGRHSRAARTRLDSGLHRHPHPVRPAARIPAHAARAR
jgi:hypothetical protein